MGREGLSLGRLCEDEAARFLKREGYRILERNYRSVFGEIDIVAKESGYIVFIEVKSRSYPLFGPPHLRINRKKKKNIVNTAHSYLKKRGLEAADCRIDVVSICLDKEEGRVELIKDAFGTNF